MRKEAFRLIEDGGGERCRKSLEYLSQNFCLRLALVLPVTGELNLTVCVQGRKES